MPAQPDRAHEADLPRMPAADPRRAGAAPPGAAAGYREGARRIAPLGAATVLDGMTFGVLAAATGFAPLQALAMSLTTFGGSAQLAVASILGAGGSVGAAIAAAVLLNGRSLPMGLAAAPAFSGGRLRRFLEAQLLVDESWAVGQVAPGRWDRRLLVGAGLLLYAAWNAGTLLGALGAETIGDPRRLGLDAAFFALFLALLVRQLRSRRAIAVAALGAGIALLLVPVSPPGVPILAAGLACALGLWRR
jgi:4-azaleucine resistance transporter AzlC